MRTMQMRTMQMRTVQSVPINDGTNRFLVYSGEGRYGEGETFTIGQWFSNNNQNINTIMNTCLQYITDANRSRPENSKFNILFFAIHPSWRNNYLCWLSRVEDGQNGRFRNKAVTVDNEILPWTNYYAYTIPSGDDKQFDAIPISTPFTSKTFNNNSDRNFKNGVYNISASSSESNIGPISIQPFMAFNKITTNQQAWFSAGTAPTAFSQYTTTYSSGCSQAPYDSNGNYQSGGGCSNLWTTIDSNGSSSTSGEWLQIQLPYKLLLKQYNIITNASNFILFGSNDGNKWNKIDTKTVPAPITDITNYFIIPSNKTAYSYFRFVFVKIFTNMPQIAGSGFPTISNINGVGVFTCTLTGFYKTGLESFQPINSTTYEGLENIYSNETKLISDLADFNQKYVDYISCEKSNCSTLDLKKRAMQEAHDLILNTDIPAVNNTIPTSGLTPGQYDASFNTLLKTHNDVVKTRMELDIKLNELNKKKDTNYADFKTQMDSGMYTNILFTVLATSILYFAFTKL